MSTLDAIVNGQPMLRQTTAKYVTDVWEWPTMTMDFPVSDDVDISQFRKDRDIQVLVLKNETGSIQIIDVKQEQ